MHELTATETFFDKGARTKNCCELRGVVLLHIQSAKSLSAESSSNERAMNETRAEPGWPSDWTLDVVELQGFAGPLVADLVSLSLASERRALD